MLRHLFKMIWNKKKQNFLMTMEILVSFLVLFAVFSLIVFNVRNFNRPVGFEFDKVWALTFQIKVRDTTFNYHESVERLVRSLPEVEEVGWTGHNFPFAMSSSNSSTSYNKRQVSAEIHDADDTYGKVLGAHIIEGRWYGKQDDGSAQRPVVINETMKEKLFGSEPAVGKTLNASETYKGEKIVGVIRNMKDKGDYEVEGAAIYKRIDKSQPDWWTDILLVKLKDQQDAAFEGRLHKELSKIMKGANIEIEYLATKNKSRNDLTLVPMIILIVICTFLVLNVSLGLFGVLWYNINRRKAEIGLRRAIGATGKSITTHFIAEAMVLTSLAVTLGMFFAIQFPLMNVFDIGAAVYLIAILLAALCIFGLVVVCAFYPGKQAAAIYPAVALHED
jgi:putative ABC transport system permease protein